MTYIIENRLSRVARIFTPSTPVTQAAVFAGRTSQQEQLRTAILEPGRHAVIYGARGVGKTSLANLVRVQMTDADRPADVQRHTVLIRCTRDDHFDSLWKRFAGQVTVVPIPGVETVVTGKSAARARSTGDIAGAVADASGHVTPSVVCALLEHASRLVIVFDEFDSIADTETHKSFADTLKQLSDMTDSATVVLVGVAEDIDSLIGHHESIQRCTEQVYMPPMTAAETAELVENGFALIDGLEIEPDAVEDIISFSRGYPAFAHALAKQAASTAIRSNRDLVTSLDVFAGAVQAVQGLPYSLGEKFKTASDSRHPADTTYVTLAAAAWCGEARFRPSDVLAILERWGQEATLRNVANHLKRLSEASRGEVLVTHGTSHPSYEFRDPMLVPYVVIETRELWLDAARPQ